MVQTISSSNVYIRHFILIGFKIKQKVDALTILAFRIKTHQHTGIRDLSYSTDRFVFTELSVLLVLFSSLDSLISLEMIDHTHTHTSIIWHSFDIRSLAEWSVLGTVSDSTWLTFASVSTCGISFPVGKDLSKEHEWGAERPANKNNKIKKKKFPVTSTPLQLTKWDSHIASYHPIV